METTKTDHRTEFGLIGKNIDYSFSRSYFRRKFEIEGIACSYKNFDISHIGKFPDILSANLGIKGLNVTIPYKEKVIPYLDGLSDSARKIGAVNTIHISREQILTGHNTDYWGFQQAIRPFLPLQEKTALILGTGGASKAIAYALRNMGFDVRFVSRTKSETTLTYLDLDKKTMLGHHLIVNCTPLGTFPNKNEFPPIPFEFLTKDHLLFDLIYNPAETEFLKKGSAKGAKISNGLKMLEFQAEKAWEIWNS